MKAFFQLLFPSEAVYRNFIFIPVFFALYLTQKVYGDASFLLDHFHGRPLSIATYEGVDVEARVKLFYKAILFASVLFLFFTQFILQARKVVNEQELKLCNFLSLAGIPLLYFSLTGADVSESINVLLALMGICASGFVLHQVVRRDQRDFTLALIWVTLLSFCLFFVFRHLSYYVVGIKLFHMPLFLLITGIPLYYFFTGSRPVSEKMISISRPLAFIPLVSFLSLEVNYIFMSHGIRVNGTLLYLIGIGFLLATFYYFHRKDKTTNETAYRLIFFRWMPWMLAGVLCAGFYHPTVTVAFDPFEDANRILPLHQWFSFGRVPFLDSFNAHALTDFGMGLLYSMLNGHDPAGVYVYGPLIRVITLVVLYLLLYKISGNGFLAIWLVLLFPLTEILIPAYFNLLPLVVLAFITFMERRTVASSFFFFFSLLFIVLWRVDLGTSAIAATAAMFILLFFMKMLPPKNKILGGFTTSFSPAIVLFILALIYSGTSLFVALKDILAYTSSFQSYGLANLAYAHDAKYFTLYYVFPAAILAIVINMIYGLVNSRYEGSSVNFAWAIIFFSLFYFANLQRGLVRHTLAEQWDAALTSYAFFIISSWVFLIMRKKETHVRFLAFVTASIIIVVNYTYNSPPVNLGNNFGIVTAGLYQPDAYSVNGEKRWKEEQPNHYTELVSWMNDHLQPDETFIDFSNTPMLYYYANRMVPNYFVQMPHTAHNDYLQERMIEDFLKYKTPALVFSNVPRNFWDNLDGIPNAFRHYKVSEYLFHNYKPSIIAGQHSVWVKPTLPDGAIPEREMELIPERFQLNMLTKNANGSITAQGDRGYLQYDFEKAIDLSGKKYSIVIHLTSDHETDIYFRYAPTPGSLDEKQKSKLHVLPGSNKLFIMLQPEEGRTKTGSISLEIPYGLNVTLHSAEMIGSRYYPDYVSTLPQAYALKWIPYYWGEFDEKIKRSTPDAERSIVTSETPMNPGQSIRFAMKPIASKEHGNYVQVQARAEEETDLIVQYGIAEERLGAFSFRLKGDGLSHQYLVRVSTQYNWHARDATWIELGSFGKIKIDTLNILKGD